MAVAKIPALSGRLSLKILTLTNSNTLDRIGVAASCLCAVHCALAPLLLATLPLLGAGFLVEERTEWAIICVSVAVGIFSLVPAYIGTHRRCSPLVIFGTGLCVIVVARLWLDERLHFELPIVAIGALLISAAHVLNLRLCRSCELCAAIKDNRQFNVCFRLFVEKR
jgi:hypothetical protein